MLKRVPILAAAARVGKGRSYPIATPNLTMALADRTAYLAALAPFRAAPYGAQAGSKSSAGLLVRRLWCEPLAFMT